LEEVCRQMGRSYQNWTLPSVRIRTKVLVDGCVNKKVNDAVRLLEGLVV
jgi:hypothetical protein